QGIAVLDLQSAPGHGDGAEVTAVVAAEYHRAGAGLAQRDAGGACDLAGESQHGVDGDIEGLDARGAGIDNIEADEVGYVPGIVGDAAAHTGDAKVDRVTVERIGAALERNRLERGIG